MTELDRASIAAMRRSYGEVGMKEGEIALDPFSQFHRWLSEAATNILVVEANAMVLSTVANGAPTSRTVLLKDLSPAGFTFFTNYESGKGKQIAGNPAVSLLFPWYPMERQVIVLGTATKLPLAESAEYFATRPWGSQIGAWASSQSAELESREVLESRFDEFATLYPKGTAVPKPENWGGYVVAPTSFEFWQGRHSRLHDRIRYLQKNGGWEVLRLYP
jgi:pyridoxamine 5'-phosphate oxidase